MFIDELMWDSFPGKHQTIHPRLPALVTGLGLGMLTASAAVVHVDQNRPGEETGDGASWSSAFKTVSEGMAAAINDDEIWVAKGTYLERVTVKSGVKLYGGFAGTEALLYERDWTVNRSILDGQAGGTVVTVEAGAGADTRVDGLVIRNGYGGAGGGIQAINSSPVIAHNRVRDNRATVAGAGIYLANGSALILSNRIDGNYLTNVLDQVMAGGGGIISSNGSPVIRGNQIARNWGFFGGGIRCWEGSAVIEGNSVSANRSDWGVGAGIEVYRASVLIERNRVVGNAGLQSSGGGLSIFESPDATVRNNLIAGNHAYSDGSGAWSAASVIRLVNNTFIGNETKDSQLSAVQLEGANVQGVNNLIVSGGGVRLGSADGWRNNCVFGNHPANYLGGLPDPTGSNGNISTDPLLAWSRELADFHLQPGSPCVDAGTLTGVTAGVEDFDGEPRTLGASVDMGADELGAVPVEFVPRIVHVSVQGNAGNHGTSWADALPTVQRGLADAVFDGAEVWVAAGTYHGPMELQPSVKLFGGFGGGEVDRNTRDPIANRTIFDGGGSTNVIRGDYLDTIAEVNGFVVQNGWASQGAGLRLFRAPVTVTQNVFQSNETYFHGGTSMTTGVGAGVYMEKSDARIVRNAFRSNRGMRGAIGVIGGSPQILGNSLTANLASSLTPIYWSAGIYLDPSLDALPVIANNWFSGNTLLDSRFANFGRAQAIFTHRPVRIVNNSFVGNLSEDLSGLPFDPAETSVGAAVWLEIGGSVLANNLFLGNWRGIHAIGDTTISNNCFHLQIAGDVVGSSAASPQAGNIFVDPKLVGSHALLHLGDDSPCRDAGNSDLVDPSWFDQDGDARIVGSAVDIGADEYSGPLPPEEPRLVFVRTDGDDQADGRTWANAKATIQSGIDTASELGGGEVWVARGTYPERIHVRPFTYVHGGFVGDESLATGRNLLTNQTVIDAQGQGTAVTLTAPGPYSALTGVTLINGRGLLGGGIYCGPLSEPLVANNRIVNCVSANTPAGLTSATVGRYFGGAGIRGEGANPTIVNNLIVANTAESFTFIGRLCAGGSGIALSDSTQALIAGNTLAHNSAYLGIGAISLSAQGTEIRNNLIAFNSAGVSATVASNPVIENNGFFGNTADPLTGTSSILTDPNFLDDRATFFISALSDCIDAGSATGLHPEWTDVYGRPRVSGSAVDIGAVELQPSDTVVPVSPVPSFTVEVLGGIAYLKYERASNPGHTGELVPTPRLDGSTIHWDFQVSLEPASAGSASAYVGTIPLGPLAPGAYLLQSSSWGVPLDTTAFQVPIDAGRTLTSPVLTPGGFQFSINGVDHVRYHLHITSDFEFWDAIGSVDGADQPVLIPNHRLTGNDFVRVQLEPLELGQP